MAFEFILSDGFHTESSNGPYDDNKSLNQIVDWNRGINDHGVVETEVWLYTNHKTRIKTDSPGLINNSVGWPNMSNFKKN